MPTFLDPEIVSFNTVLPSVSGSVQGAGGQRCPGHFVLWLCGTCCPVLRSDDRAHARSMTHSASVCTRPVKLYVINKAYMVAIPTEGAGEGMVCSVLGPVTQPEVCLPHVAREVE